MNTINIQKIKKGIVGCVVLVFMVGHSIAQGMMEQGMIVQGIKRKRDIDTSLLRVIEGVSNYENPLILANNMIAQKTLESMIHHDQRDVFEKITSIHNAVVVEPAKKIKIKPLVKLKFEFVGCKVFKNGKFGYQCAQCIFFTVHKNRIEPHYQAHAIMERKPTKKMHCCDTCGYLTGRLSTFQDHEASHQNKNFIQCPTYGCGRKVKSKRNLQRHMQRVHNKKTVG